MADMQLTNLLQLRLGRHDSAAAASHRHLNTSRICCSVDVGSGT